MGTKPNKSNLPNQTYQTKPTKPTKPNLLVKAVNTWVRSAFGNVFFHLFPNIFSQSLFFISIQMFSLRKYFPYFISPSQSRYFFPSYFPYLSSPSQSNNYFPSPIISLFFFIVLLPPNYPFSSFLFLK